MKDGSRVAAACILDIKGDGHESKLFQTGVSVEARSASCTENPRSISQASPA